MENLTATDIFAALGALGAVATAAQQVALQLQKLAKKTQSSEDDKWAARAVALTGLVARVLNWFSFGPTPKKR